MNKKALTNVIELLQQRLQFAKDINDEGLQALLMSELNRKYDELLDVIRGELNESDL